MKQITIRFTEKEEWIYQRLLAVADKSGYRIDQIIIKAIKAAVKDAPLFFNNEIYADQDNYPERLRRRGV